MFFLPYKYDDNTAPTKKQSTGNKKIKCIDYMKGSKHPDYVKIKYCVYF